MMLSFYFAGDSGHYIKDGYRKSIRGAPSGIINYHLYMQIIKKKALYDIRCDCCNYIINGM